MTKGNAKQWLDALIDSIVCLEQVAHRIKDEGVDTVTIVPPDQVHIYSGIDILAEALGLKLTKTKRECGEFPYMYSFNYRGKLVYQLEEEQVDEWKS